MKLRFGNGNEEEYPPYIDAIDFAEAATWDEETRDGVLENLRDMQEIAGPDSRVSGYCREAEQVINQWQLGKN